MFSSKANFKKEFQARLLERFGVDIKNSCANEQYTILGEMVRDYANKNLFHTHNESTAKGKKTLIYFSMEFLIGRLLNNNMQNLGIYDVIKGGLDDLGIDIKEIKLEKENGTLFLRIFIDKEPYINIDDCVEVTNIVNPILDENDFIDESYILDISSIEKGGNHE